MKNNILVFILCVLCSCNIDKSSSNISSVSKKDFTQYVNPFIGTSKMGHVFPGATAPFGMVQLSPQTNFEPMFNQTTTVTILIHTSIVQDINTRTRQ